MTATEFQAALTEIRALYEFLGRVSVFARAGQPEAQERYSDVLARLDLKYRVMLDEWPAARDDSGIIEQAKAVRRLVHEQEA